MEYNIRGHFRTEWTIRALVIRDILKQTESLRGGKMSSRHAKSDRITWGERLFETRQNWLNHFGGRGQSSLWDTPKLNGSLRRKALRNTRKTNWITSGRERLYKTLPNWQGHFGERLFETCKNWQNHFKGKKALWDTPKLTKPPANFRVSAFSTGLIPDIRGSCLVWPKPRLNHQAIFASVLFPLVWFQTYEVHV